MEPEKHGRIRCEFRCSLARDVAGRAASGGNLGVLAALRLSHVGLWSNAPSATFTCVGALVQIGNRKLGQSWMSFVPPVESEADMIATSKAVAARQGELLRDVGVNRAATNHQQQIERDELRFLDALVLNGEGTLDDAVVDLTKKHADNGKWRGSIPLRLARQRLIVAIGYRRSSRTHRHSGTVCVWAIRDRTAVEARRLALREKFLTLDSKDTKTASTTGIVETVKITHSPKGEISDGQVNGHFKRFRRKLR